MIGARRIILLVSVSLSVQLIAACAMFKNKEKGDLPPERSAKVLVFPTDSLEFKGVTCLQEFDKMTLTGKVKNVSFSPVANVRIRAVILFAGDAPGDYISETFNLAVDPLVLQPMEWGSFSLVGTVHKTISHAEFHARWEPFSP